ncbi:MAG: AbrB/MazE/SpoVT family DNA-binding domain-containing protein [Nanoarchaeota archaeon]|nr:AbrB/MazE/SpoVT family DNA-binding domain-containing protein [Nanoarchaeota archaeon]
MKRKVSQIGPATLMVSLPAAWAKKNNILKGHEIELTESDHSIILSPSTISHQPQSMDISFNTAKEFHKRSLEIPYIEGIDELRISYNDPKVIDLVQDGVERLHGLEIVDQRKNQVVIKNIARGENEELDVLIRRIFLMLINSVQESIEYLKSGDLVGLGNLVNAEKISSKLIHFCLRGLNLYGYKNKKKTYALFTTIWGIEQVLDHYADVAEHLESSKKTLNKKEVAVYESIFFYLKSYYQLLYKFDTKDFVQFYDYRKGLEQNIKSLATDPNSDKIIMTYLYGIYDRIYHMGIFVNPSSRDFI